MMTQTTIVNGDTIGNSKSTNADSNKGMPHYFRFLIRQVTTYPIPGILTIVFKNVIPHGFTFISYKCTNLINLLICIFKFC